MVLLLDNEICEKEWLVKKVTAEKIKMHNALIPVRVCVCVCVCRYQSKIRATIFEIFHK